MPQGIVVSREGRDRRTQTDRWQSLCWVRARRPKGFEARPAQPQIRV